MVCETLCVVVASGMAVSPITRNRLYRNINPASLWDGTDRAVIAQWPDVYGDIQCIIYVSPALETLALSNGHDCAFDTTIVTTSGVVDRNVTGVPASRVWRAIYVSKAEQADTVPLAARNELGRYLAAARFSSAPVTVYGWIVQDSFDE